MKIGKVEQHGFTICVWLEDGRCVNVPADKVSNKAELKAKVKEIFDIQEGADKSKEPEYKTLEGEIL